MASEQFPVPPPPEVRLLPKAEAVLLDTLTLVNACVADTAPGVIPLPRHKIKVLDSAQYTDWIAEFDLAAAHPFYRALIAKSGIDHRHTDVAFDNVDKETSYYHSAVFDNIEEKATGGVEPELGFHLITSTLSLGHDHIISDTQAIQPAALSTIARTLPQIPEVTPQEVEQGLQIARNEGCEVRIYGAAHQIWVGGKIFTPLLGSEINEAITNLVNTQIRTSLIEAMTNNFGMSKEENVRWLQTIFQSSLAEKPNLRQIIFYLSNTFRYRSVSHILGAYSSSQIGLFLFNQQNQ